MPKPGPFTRIFCGRNYVKCVVILLLSAAMTVLVEMLFMKTNRFKTTIIPSIRKTDNTIIDSQRPVYNTDTQKQLTRTDYIDSIVLNNKFNGRNMNVVNTSQVATLFDAGNKKWCVPFYSRQKDAKICVYNPVSDIWVSGSIVKTGAWEKDLLNLTEEFQMTDPNLALLDIGCNIGVFTVFYSGLGRKVVGIDANKQNVILLSKSLSLNGLQDRVTLINNAVSDIRQGVVLKETSGNVGGTMVKAVENTVDNTEQVSTILINDLIPFFKNNSVLIKIDIEGYEWKAINGSWEFFKSVNVKYVLMEYVQHKRKETGQHIRSFFAQFGFLPYKVPDYTIQLDVANDSDWPGDMIWIKKETVKEL